MAVIIVRVGMMTPSSQALYVGELKLEARGGFRGLERMFLFGMCSSLTDRRDKLWEEAPTHFLQQQNVWSFAEQNPFTLLVPVTPSQRDRYLSFQQRAQEGSVTVRKSHGLQGTKLGFKHGFDARVLPANPTPRPSWCVVIG